MLLIIAFAASSIAADPPHQDATSTPLMSILSHSAPPMSLRSPWLWDWADLGPSTAVQILDDPGRPENPGESEH
ncbi:MAG TPA: hypothetical protein VGI75_02450 [Pirellulales bacterium]